MNTPPPLYVPRVPRRKDEQMARVHAEEIHPLMGQRLERLALDLLRKHAGALPADAQVVHIGTGGGALTSDLATLVGDDARLIALDASPALLDRARARLDADHPGRRVFFRTHDAGDKLPFSDASCDVVVAVMTAQPLGELSDEAGFLADLARVLRPAGALVLASPVRGTFIEFLDIFRDVLAGRPTAAPARALEAHLKRQPDPEDVARLLEQAGLIVPDIERTRWELVFRTAREFLYAPVIEHGPLQRWKDIAGQGDEMQDIFLGAKEAIETYFTGRPFVVAVEAAAWSATRVGA